MTWIPASAPPPVDEAGFSELVLVYPHRDHTLAVVACYCRHRNRFETEVSADPLEIEPTHWMPLPDPPVERVMPQLTDRDRESLALIADGDDWLNRPEHFFDTTHALARQGLAQFDDDDPAWKLTDAGRDRLLVDLLRTVADLRDRIAELEPAQ